MKTVLFIMILLLLLGCEHKRMSKVQCYKIRHKKLDTTLVTSKQCESIPPSNIQTSYNNDWIYLYLLLNNNNTVAYRYESSSPISDFSSVKWEDSKDMKIEEVKETEVRDEVEWGQEVNEQQIQENELSENVQNEMEQSQNEDVNSESQLSDIGSDDAGSSDAGSSDADGDAGGGE